MANFSAENIYESKRWDMYVFLVCFVIINFFLLQKNIFFFNLIYNESDTEKLNFEFYYNDINRCNMQYCILFSEFYFLCTCTALQDAYIIYLFFSLGSIWQFRWLASWPTEQLYLSFFYLFHLTKVLKLRIQNCVKKSKIKYI